MNPRQILPLALIPVAPLPTDPTYVVPPSFDLSPTNLAALKACMLANHEATPAGVPVDYSWQQHGVIDNLRPPYPCDCITGWGWAFAVDPTAPAVVYIGQLRTYLRKNGVWTFQSSTPQGGLFRADFQGNESTPINTEDGLITTADVSGNKAYHFFADSRWTYDADSDAVMIVFQARADKPNTVLVGAGCDYWTTASAPWIPDYTHPNNPDLGSGQLRFAAPDWRWYGFMVER